MTQTLNEFLQSLPPGRSTIIEIFHQAIIDGDASVVPAVKPMMGKEMILYEEGATTMKYALAVTAKQLSFHCLPMYMKPDLYTKFSALLPTAKFQKGCINFSNETEFPVATLKQIIADCALVDITAVLAARKKK